MRISKTHTIRDIKAQFSQMFPGLKIEVYKESHQDHEGSPITAQYSEHISLGDIVPNLSDTDLTVDETMTVFEFEELFKQLLGLNIQVFRRSRELWLQTSATDHWTLETQNRKGMRSLTVTPGES